MDTTQTLGVVSFFFHYWRSYSWHQMEHSFYNQEPAGSSPRDHHPSSVSIPYRGAGAYLQQSTGGVHPGQVPNTSQGNTDTQPCTHTFILNGNQERQIDQTVTFSDCGRKLEYLERTHACTGRTCKPCRKTPGQELNPGCFCCKAAVLPTTPSCNHQGTPRFQLRLENGLLITFRNSSFGLKPEKILELSLPVRSIQK
ncbi:hypothetical protein GOODEAATRI_026379 [Goodea atripinnis]|uniref:Uncharacterized protein n=1 Tax=Goodea atripinnis TaxID=208336 RepID=A0ABV0MNW9_9TELE